MIPCEATASREESIMTTNSTPEPVDLSKIPDVDLEISPDDEAWDLEGDDSVGDADDPHRNDDQIEEPTA